AGFDNARNSMPKKQAHGADLHLLPKLGGAIVARPVRDPRHVAKDAKVPPREFKPVGSAAKLQPDSKPATFAAAQPGAKTQFVENPFVKRGVPKVTLPQRPRHRLAATNAFAAPTGPSLEYDQLPQELRDSLESKIKQRTEAAKRKPEPFPLAAPPRQPQPTQVRIKPLAAPRTAQLDDPFRDDPDQTPPPARPRPRPVDPGVPMPAPGDAAEPVVEVLESTRNLDVTVRRSKLIRTRFDIYRAAVVDTSICDVVQFTPREVSIIGRGQGATNVTFWFEDGKHKPVTYLVRVVPDPEVQQRREEQYTVLEDVLAELFPDSKVHLIPVSDKLIVKGQAKGAAEAAQILAIIRGQTGVTSRDGRSGNSVIDGTASDPIVTEATERRLPVSQVINMLRVPGVQQVALRVKIAELNRTAARGFGVDIDAIFQAGSGTLAIQSLLNFAAGGDTATSILGSFSNNDIQFGIRYLQQKGIVRILSEPTLVTMSGREANFIAGGEFAVPTTVGVGGASAVTTDFRAFGAIISFLPTVIDKDRIRLQVSPEFSKVNESLAVDGTPGLDTRSVTTTVEMREGQTLAIAGLLEDSMEGDITSDLPIVGKYLGRRDMKRNETELIIIVTPELVHPMDPEEVPPLPGFDVTEPNDREFYLGGRLEGRPTVEHRSTVWPSLMRRYRSGGDSMISGPFGHGQ
ncbi:MAG: pilus assembly protein N-terminal domain-containing protein, partial [Pirellulales bacterium]|nr:pilus assembly protein N-terminal domain-containing protein [Pirellulales bacterium]